MSRRRTGCLGGSCPAEGLALEGVDPGGTLARAIPAERVLGGVAHVGSRVRSPGVVRLMEQDRMLYGDPSGRHPQAVAALVEALARGGIPAKAIPDIRMEVWLKLWG